MTTKELLDEYYWCKVSSEIPTNTIKHQNLERMHEIIKELETSIRKDVAKEQKERWIKVFDYHNDLASGRHTFYREEARVEIEYWDKLIKGITLK